MYITESQGGNTCKKNLTENKSICKKKKNVLNLSKAAGGLWNSTSSSNFSLHLEMKLLKSLPLQC